MSYSHDDMKLDVFHLASRVTVADAEPMAHWHADVSTVGSLAHFGEPAEGWAAGLVIVVAEWEFQCLKVEKK